MKILLGSNNPSKRTAVEIALKKMGFDDYEIISYNAPSNTSTKPIGYEIIRGAENRNKALKEYALQNNIEYDYLCSIEGGFSLDENGLPFVITYCVIEDQSGIKSTGKSLGVRITKIMFDYLKSGGSLNAVIERITKKNKNKQSLGIIGYLSNGLYDRKDIDSEAVISSLIPLILKKQREELDQHIQKMTKEKTSSISTQTM